MTISTAILQFFLSLPKRILSWKFFLRLFVFCPLIIVILFLAFWMFLSTETISCLITLDEAKKHTFDYVIVGGGTAGCILASRLSENPALNVLLIEAGGTFSPLAMVPFLTSQQQKTQNDWKLQTISQKYSSFGFYDQVQYLPRGKGLGGSSNMNYLLHFDGNKRDLDRWKSFGVDLWHYDSEDDVSIQKDAKSDCSEDVCTAPDKNIPEIVPPTLFRTRFVTTPITYDYSMLSSKFVDGSMELHQKNLSSLEYHLVKYNTYHGLRYSSYHAYLRPAFTRPNLKVVMSTRVRKVVFQNKNAIGVSVTADNHIRAPETIHAAKEVILAAGAFQSPQILKLSGIGPMKELRRFEINVVHNSPMVGRNLYDHMSMPIYVSVNETMSVTRSKVLNVYEILNYLLHGTGTFSNFGVIGYLNDAENDHGTGIFGVGTIDERLLRKIVNYDGEVFRQNFPFYNDSKQEGFVLLNSCYQPLSRGTVRLSSNKIYDHPEIDPNYLEKQEDVDCIIRAIRLSIKLIQTDAFKAVDAKIHWPRFNQCKNFFSADGETDVTDQYLECIIRVAAVTAHHPGGSCAIGQFASSVLDSRMRVRGVRKLRVVDASIIPSPVSGTPHTAIAAMAEWASQIILYKL